MKETPRSLRIYFGLCAALQLFWGLSLLASFSLFSLLGLLFVGVGAFFAFITYRLPELLRTSTRPVVLALGLEIGVALIGAILNAVMGAGIVGVVIQLLFSAAVTAYLYRSVQRLSAEARGGAMPVGQMPPPAGYGAPQLQPSPPPYEYPHPQPPYQAPPSYTALPTQQQQPPLGPGMQCIVNSPDGRRIPAFILQEQNGQFLCDSQGGQGWVPAHLVTRT